MRSRRQQSPPQVRAAPVSFAPSPLPYPHARPQTAIASPTDACATRFAGFEHDASGRRRYSNDFLFYFRQLCTAVPPGIEPETWSMLSPGETPRGVRSGPPGVFSVAVVQRISWVPSCSSPGGMLLLQARPWGAAGSLRGMTAGRAGGCHRGPRLARLACGLTRAACGRRLPASGPLPGEVRSHSLWHRPRVPSLSA